LIYYTLLDVKLYVLSYFQPITSFGKKSQCLLDVNIKFWGLNFVEDRDEIEEIKCLMVNLHETKIKDLLEKGAEIQG
jgi:hypothetical protein